MIQCNDAHPEDKYKRQLILMLTCGIVLLGVLAFAAHTIRFYQHTIDDSFITFRYATNFASGQGMVFNPGEQPRAEGITSPLYAVILSLAPITGVDIVTFSKLLGLIACLLTTVLIAVIIYKICLSVTSLSRISVILVSCSGAMYYLSNPFVIGNAVSGMETSLAAMTFGAFLFLVLRIMSSAPQPTLFTILLTGVVATLVPMFRPEMVLSVITVLAITAWMWPGGRRPLLQSTVVFLILGTTYYCLRYYYYGLPFPLPFYIKQGSFGIYDLHGVPQIYSYLSQEVFLLLLVLFCFAFIFGPLRNEKKHSCVYLISLLVALGVQLAYYATITPIMGMGYRFFQPISVAFVSLAFVGGAILYEAAGQSRLTEKFSLPLLFTSLVAVSILSNGASQEARFRYASSMRPYFKIARSMKAAAGGKNIRIAINDCGIIPFYTGFPTLDLAGLNNRAIALGGAPAAINEIKRQKPNIVALISNEKHGLTSLRGLERLTSEEVIQCGYKYVGTMTVGSTYHFLVFAQTDQTTKSFLRQLEEDGVLEVPLTKNHSSTMEAPDGPEYHLPLTSAIKPSMALACCPAGRC